MYHNTSTKQFILIAIVLSLALTYTHASFANSRVLDLGVWHDRIDNSDGNRWRHLVKYLEQELPDLQFNLHILSSDEIDRYVRSNKLDFVLTNPSHYIALREQLPFSSALATLHQSFNNQAVVGLGGVIVSRNDQLQAETLEQITHLKIASPDRSALAAFQAQLYEFHLAGIDINQLHIQEIAGPQDQVIHAVLNNEVDVGFVRTGLIEEMVAEDKLDTKDLKIINQQNFYNYPFYCSTRLYPNWPFIALPYVDAFTAQRVTASLLMLEIKSPDTINDIGIHGFSIPASYIGVEKIMHELHMPPFHKIQNKVSPSDIWREYKALLMLALFAFLIIGLLIVMLLWDQRVIRKSLRKLAEQKHAIDQHSIVATTDIKGNITYTNDKFSEISGYSREELLGKNHRILNSGYHSQDFFRNIYLTISKGSVWHGELCNVDKFGKIYWVDTTIVPFMNEKNKPESYLSIRSDITEQKHAEERWKFALESAQEGVWDWDCQTDIVLYASNWKKLLGYGDQEIGYSLSEWSKRIHEDDRDRSLADLHEHLEAKTEYFENEQRLLCKDGNYKWFLCRGKVISRDQKNVPLRMISTIHDITERKEAESYIRHAHKMEAIGQLTGGIAHDFNNLLGIITGNLELLEMIVEDNPKAMKRVQNTLKAAQRAIKLTSQLLGVSRKKAADSTVTNVNQVIESMEEILQQSKHGNIEIDYELSENANDVFLDAGDLQDAILNLVINAKDAMDGQGSITIKTFNCVLDGNHCRNQVCAPPGDYVCISVKDTGPGIPSDIQQKIFEPFFTTKSVGKGTGLGLGMVFGFVQRSNGYIEVVSEINEGAEFLIYLPQLDSQRDKKSKPIEMQLNHRVLILSDDSSHAELTKARLKTLGYEAFIANNDIDARQTLDKHHDIDILLDDAVKLDNCNLSFIKEILESYPKIHLLQITQNSKPEHEVQIDSTRSISITKPYTTQTLSEKIDQLFSVH